MEATAAVTTARFTNGDRYANVDFTKSNQVIGQELNITREAVRQKRKALGLPRYRANKADYITTPAQDKLRQINVEDIRHMSMAQLKDQLGVCEESIRRFARNEGVYIRNGLEIYPYSEWNWDLPNSVLDEVWHTPNNTSAAARFRLKKGRMKWDIRFGHAREDPELEKAIKIEERKYIKHKNDIERYQEVRRVRRAGCQDKRVSVD